MKKLKYVFIAFAILLGLIWVLYMPLLTAYTDYINEKCLTEIKQLDRASYSIFNAFIQDIEAKTDWRVLIVSGYRSEESQAILKKMNPKNANPGQSKHNFGKAIDVCVFKPSGFGARWLKKNSSKKAWEDSQITAIAQAHRLNWGGNFKHYHDPVHFEID